MGLGRVALVLLVLAGCGDRIKQDACLDNGGCWDHSKHRCEMQDQSRCAAQPSEK